MEQNVYRLQRGAAFYYWHEGCQPEVPEGEKYTVLPLSQTGIGACCLECGKTIHNADEIMAFITRKPFLRKG